jgi:hypothetical protein
MRKAQVFSAPGPHFPPSLIRNDMSDEYLNLISRFLRYDPDTGYIHWRKTRSSAKVGSVAGTYKPHDPGRIGLGGRYFNGENIALYLLDGEWPASPVRHLNGNRWDNRLDNLQLT